MSFRERFDRKGQTCKMDETIHLNSLGSFRGVIQ